MRPIDGQAFQVLLEQVDLENLFTLKQSRELEEGIDQTWETLLPVESDQAPNWWPRQDEVGQPVAEPRRLETFWAEVNSKISELSGVQWDSLPPQRQLRMLVNILVDMYQSRVTGAIQLPASSGSPSASPGSPSPTSPAAPSTPW